MMEGIVAVPVSIIYQLFGGLLLGALIGGAVGEFIELFYGIKNPENLIEFSGAVFSSLFDLFSLYFVTYLINLNSQLDKVEHPGNRIEILKNVLIIGGAGAGAFFGKNFTMLGFPYLSFFLTCWVVYSRIHKSSLFLSKKA